MHLKSQPSEHPLHPHHSTNILYRQVVDIGLPTNIWENVHLKFSCPRNTFFLKHYFKLMSPFPVDQIPLGFHPHRNPCFPFSPPFYLNGSRTRRIFFFLPCYIFNLCYEFCLWPGRSSNAVSRVPWTSEKGTGICFMFFRQILLFREFKLSAGHSTFIYLRIILTTP